MKPKGNNRVRVVTEKPFIVRVGFPWLVQFDYWSKAAMLAAVLPFIFFLFGSRAGRGYILWASVSGMLVLVLFWIIRPRMEIRIDGEAMRTRLWPYLDTWKRGEVEAYAVDSRGRLTVVGKKFRRFETGSQEAAVELARRLRLEFTPLPASGPPARKNFFDRLANGTEPEVRVERHDEMTRWEIIPRVGPLNLALEVLPVFFGAAWTAGIARVITVILPEVAGRDPVNLFIQGFLIVGLGGLIFAGFAWALKNSVEDLLRLLRGREIIEAGPGGVVSRRLLFGAETGWQVMREEIELLSALLPEDGSLEITTREESRRFGFHLAYYQARDIGREMARTVGIDRDNTFGV